ncbi:MAG: phosphoenolpyruvate synthase [Patescibacteria group bacterium]|nr:phosphoenolpyruvate synthase [Patescibacteria group bacterium]
MKNLSAKKSALVLWFDDITKDDVGLVGGKNANLGEMWQKVTPAGIKVPHGFAITAAAYKYFLKFNNLDKKIRGILKGINTKDIHNLEEKGAKVREAIVKAKIPPDLKKEIMSAYAALSKEYRVGEVDVAVRSSATAEDLPSASFAGQQESYLNIRGEANLSMAVKKCFASLFTDRAISYRHDRHFDHFKVYLSIGVQKMVRSDLAASGVMFTLDTDSGFRNIVLINASYGLGENVVLGRVNPDEYIIFKPALASGYKAVIDKSLGTKAKRLIYHKGAKPTLNISTPEKDRGKFALSDKEILQLARWGVLIEKHYGRPMDIEWAKDGQRNDLFIVQARPETVQSIKDPYIYESYLLKNKGRVLIEGVAVGEKISQGKARVIKSISNISEFKPGEVLITEMTDPDWEPIMKIASAIVTNSGGRTSHAAIVSRELGVPAVVGTKTATEVIKTGRDITVSCAEGEVGKIYDGKIDYQIKKIDLKKLKKPETKIMMNVGDPEKSFGFSFIPNDGVGLAREEFIINDYIKIHPLALLNFKKIKDKKLISEINEQTLGYNDKVEFYVDRLAYGIARIAASFYPKPVIVRTSDFKSNEYSSLLGGKIFEPHEENPMIGWRGASRYSDPKFAPAFALECRAIKKVREEMGLTNLIVMLPFVRTLTEAKRTIKIMEDNGLRRGKNVLKIYQMVEIPSNAILAEDFAKLFDGFSIGSNDLTQLTLGIDRDSKTVAGSFSELNPAVLRLIKEAIEKAHRAKPRVKIGICGQAPSDYPEMVEFLVKNKIDSISLNPDSVLKMILTVLATEKKIKTGSKR